MLVWNPDRQDKDGPPVRYETAHLVKGDSPSYVVIEIDPEVAGRAEWVCGSEDPEEVRRALITYFTG